MIYFVEAMGLDRVKIGTSTDVAARLRSLATLCPCPVRLLRTVEGRHWDERYLHGVFAAHRVNGEWFVLSAIEHAIPRIPNEPRRAFDYSELTMGERWEWPFIEAAHG